MSWMIRSAWLNELLANYNGHNQNIFNRRDENLPLGLRNFDALIENESEAALHSGKLVQALTQKVQAAGVNILYGATVAGWEKVSSGIQVQLNEGATVAADQLAFMHQCLYQ
jgi:gamma-glutamylputrescine oxidase